MKRIGLFSPLKIFISTFVTDLCLNCSVVSEKKQFSVALLSVVFVHVHVFCLEKSCFLLATDRKMLLLKNYFTHS